MVIKKIYYKICKGIARIIFPKRKMAYEVMPEENDASIFVCNHSGAIGPVNMTLYFDRPARPWIVDYIFDKEVGANFVFHDFFFARSKKCKWFWRGLAKLVVFFLRPMLEMQNAIHVFKANAKARQTFEESVEALKNGDNVIIFPECPNKFSKYICEFYDGFVMVGKYLYEQTGKIVKFYPVYVPPQLKTINVGEPISYNPNVSPKENRQIISKYLKEKINEIAENLPEHKPIPFLTDDFYNYYGEFIDNMDEYWQFVNQKHSD